MEFSNGIFGSLIVFVYHCFDRIVIRGYLPAFMRTENVVYFFKEVVKAKAITKEVLSERTNCYQKWVEAFAAKKMIPLQWAEKDVRKEDIVQSYLKKFERENRFGIYYIFMSMEQENTFRCAEPKYKTKDPNYRILKKQRSRFTHYYFYLRDEKLGASATSALVPMEEQLAVLGAMQATISGSEAGTKYRAFMKSAAKAGIELGMSFTDARGQLKPMVEILKLIKARYGETISAVQKVKLQEAFGRIESVALIDLLLPQIDSLSESIGSVKAAMEGGTVGATQMALAMSDNLGSALGLLKNVPRNTFEEIGKTVLPMVRIIISKVTSAIKAFQNWARAHLGLVKLGMTEPYFTIKITSV